MNGNGVITTHCVSNVIKPGDKQLHDPLQFVKIKSTDLCQKVCLTSGLAGFSPWLPVLANAKTNQSNRELPFRPRTNDDLRPASAPARNHPPAL